MINLELNRAAAWQFWCLLITAPDVIENVRVDEMSASLSNRQNVVDYLAMKHAVIWDVYPLTHKMDLQLGFLCCSFEVLNVWQNIYHVKNRALLVKQQVQLRFSWVQKWRSHISLARPKIKSTLDGRVIAHSSIKPPSLRWPVAWKSAPKN